MSRTWKQRWVAGRALVDRRLRLQLRIFLAVFVVMVILVVARIFQDDVNPLWELAGFAAGLALGFFVARTNVLAWQPSEGMVAGTMDALGVIILVTYLTFLVFRSRLLGSRVHDAETVGVIGLAMTGGAMLGRVYFTMRGIRRILFVAGLRPTRRP